MTKKQNNKKKMNMEMVSSGHIEYIDIEYDILFWFQTTAHKYKIELCQWGKVNYKWIKFTFVENVAIWIDGHYECKWPDRFRLRVNNSGRWTCDWGTVIDFDCFWKAHTTQYSSRAISLLFNFECVRRSLEQSNWRRRMNSWWMLTPKYYSFFVVIIIVNWKQISILSFTARYASMTQSISNLMSHYD